LPLRRQRIQQRPQRSKAGLFDHFVRRCEQRRQNRKLAPRLHLSAGFTPLKIFPPKSRRLDGNGIQLVHLEEKYVSTGAILYSTRWCAVHELTNLGFGRSVIQLSQSVVCGRASNRQFEIRAGEGTCPVRLVAAPSVRELQ
jgi:hypothetical protein